MPKCCVPICPHHSDRAIVRGRSFHRLPLLKPDLLKVWLSQIGRGEDWIPTVSKVICSEHFEEKCFDRTGQTTRLRENVVPTIFIPHRVSSASPSAGPHPEEKLTKEEKESKNKRQSKKKKQTMEEKLTMELKQTTEDKQTEEEKKTKKEKQPKKRKKKEMIIKFLPVRGSLRKKQEALGPDSKAGASHDHDYIGKGGTGQSRPSDKDDGPGQPRKRRRYGPNTTLLQALNLLSSGSHLPRSSGEEDANQSSSVSTEPAAGSTERLQLPQPASQARAEYHLRSHKRDGRVNLSKSAVDKEQPVPGGETGTSSNRELPDEDTDMVTLPDGQGYIKGGFFHSEHPSLPPDHISKGEKRRMLKNKQHDHSYSITDNPVVLKHRLDAACARLAEFQKRLKSYQQRNRRLVGKVETLTKEVEELRHRKFVINDTLKFLESLEYRPTDAT